MYEDPNVAGGSEYLVAVKTLLKETDESTQEMLQEAVVMARQSIVRAALLCVKPGHACLGLCSFGDPPHDFKILTAISRYRRLCPCGLGFTMPVVFVVAPGYVWGILSFVPRGGWSL